MQQTEERETPFKVFSSDEITTVRILVSKDKNGYMFFQTNFEKGTTQLH